MCKIQAECVCHLNVHLAGTQLCHQSITAISMYYMPTMSRIS